MFNDRLEWARGRCARGSRPGKTHGLPCDHDGPRQTNGTRPGPLDRRGSPSEASRPGGAGGSPCGGRGRCSCSLPCQRPGRFGSLLLPCRPGRFCSLLPCRPGRFCSLPCRPGRSCSLPCGLCRPGRPGLHAFFLSGRPPSKFNTVLTLVHYHYVQTRRRESQRE